MVRLTWGSYILPSENFMYLCVYNRVCNSLQWMVAGQPGLLGVCVQCLVVPACSHAIGFAPILSRPVLDYPALAQTARLKRVFRQHAAVSDPPCVKLHKLSDLYLGVDTVDGCNFKCH